MKKILLIGPYGLGNTILALPAMNAVREHFPECQIDLVTLLPSAYSLTQLLPDFKFLDHVFFLNFKEKISALKTIYKLRKINYDFSVLFFPSARIHYNLISFMLGAEKRIASLYPDVNFKRAHFLNHINVPVVEGVHDTIQNLLMLEPLGIKINKNKPVKLYSEIAKKNKKNIIGVHPGSKREAYYKKWDRENYVDLIYKIIQNTDFELRIFFGPDEADDAEFFKNNLNNKRIIFVENKSLGEVVDLINECRIFVSNDSGLAHIANFLGVYNIVINGPSDFRRTSPTNHPFTVLYNKDLSCIPCSHTYKVASHKFKCIYNDIRCLKTISVDEVFQAVKNAENIKIVI